MLGMRRLDIKQVNCPVCSESTSTAYFSLIVILGSLVSSEGHAPFELKPEPQCRTTVALVFLGGFGMLKMPTMKTLVLE
jgi:hypothetical protein